MDPIISGSFEMLKEPLTSAPVLAFPDFSIRFILKTDASLQGLDAMLAQQQGDKLVRPLLVQADAYNLMRGIMELLNLRTLGSCGCKIFPTLHVQTPLQYLY